MKVFRRILVLFVFLSVLAFSASANAPEPMPTYKIDLLNLPKNVTFVDLLIRLDKDDPHYIDLVEENVPKTFDKDAPILSYHIDGYCSYTFHYAEAVSKIAPSVPLGLSVPQVSFFNDDYSHYKDIAKRGEIKLVFLDLWGKILFVTEPLTANPDNFFIATDRHFCYDAATNSFDNGSYINSYSVVAVLMGIGMSAVIEFLIAFPFCFSKKSCITVLFTNFVSQAIMRIMFWMLYLTVFSNYFILTILLEVLVYTGEFLFYRTKLKGISFTHCLLYTITANTVTLVLGLLVNRLIL